jgi:hypothetical protein
MEIRELKVFINQNEEISLIQGPSVIILTADMVDLVCDELKLLKTELKDATND